MGRTLLVRGPHHCHSRRDRKSGRFCSAYSIPNSGLAAEAQAIRYRPRGAVFVAKPSSVGTRVCACMCLFVSAIVEVRGGHAAVEPVFFRYPIITPQHQHQTINHSTALWGKRGEVRGVLQSSLTWPRTWMLRWRRSLLRTWRSSFPFRSLFSAHFSSAPSAPPPPHHPNFPPSNEQCHVFNSTH